MKPKLTDEEIDRRIEKFRKVVRYRKITGLVLAVVGFALLIIGLQTGGDLLLMINGSFCLCYGAFMLRQAVQAEKKMPAP